MHPKYFQRGGVFPDSTFMPRQPTFFFEVNNKFNFHAPSTYPSFFFYSIALVPTFSCLGFIDMFQQDFERRGFASQELTFILDGN
jgi:hypothetical protein